jgi:hypothetical protein
MSRTYADGLYLCTTLTRQTPEYGPVTCDVVVYFQVDGYVPGRRETRSDPGWGAEYGLAFIGADFDGEPSDAPGPLTAIETATLREWFDKNHARAADHANDNIDMGDAA